MVGIGLVCVVLLETVLGSYTRLGATTNSGWFTLIVSLMCLAFGAMLLTLGLAKWLKNRDRRCGIMPRTLSRTRIFSRARPSASA
jgi:hypothetical protein